MAYLDLDELERARTSEEFGPDAKVEILLLPPTLWIGFTVVSVLLGLGLLQTVMTTRGKSLVPGLGGRRPDHAAPTVAFRAAEARSATRTGPADADTRPHAARPSTARMPTRTPSTAPPPLA